MSQTHQAYAGIHLRQKARLLPADMDTPISLFMGMAGAGDGILLESAAVDGRWGRYSILACDMLARVVIAPYELPIELIVGIIGSVLFIGLLLYRLKHGRKAVRLGPAHSGGCAGAVSAQERGAAG